MPDAKPTYGLALSGGGFRATLFHLGVIKLLRDTGMLRNVKRISAVSGGSILAAHLLLNWNRYTGDDAAFNAAAKELIDFVRMDVRGRVVRRWILFWLMVIPRLLKRRHWTFTNMLQTHYARLYRGARLRDLRGGSDTERPEVFFCCTSLTTGSACWFGRSGFLWIEGDKTVGKGSFKQRHIPAPNTPVAFAVAASSAFPPLFPPIAIDSEILSCDRKDYPNPQYLTDGGVYDNLGIENLLFHQQGLLDVQRFFASDAEGNFDWDFANDYTFITTRNIRASDLLMKRVSTLQYGTLRQTKLPLTVFDIDSLILKPDDPTVLDPAVQRSMRNVRTDMDAFTPTEILCIAQHGYTVAREALIQDGVLTPAVPGFKWDQLGRVDPGAPEPAKFLRAAKLRKLGIWSGRDTISWATLGVLATWCLAALFPVYYQINEQRTLKEQAEQFAGAQTRRLESVLTPDVKIPVTTSPGSPMPEAARPVDAGSIRTRPAAIQPRVYIQIASETQRASARAIAERLRGSGYLVPPIELVNPAPSRNEVRYYSNSDAGMANQIVAILSENRLTSHAVPLNRPIRRSKQFEIWFALD
jgi:predicted acylesterase/phospholipase RssA